MAGGRRYTFSEAGGYIACGDVRLFDVRAPQPEIHLYKVRFDSTSSVQSYVKYLEVSTNPSTRQEHMRI